MTDIVERLRAYAVEWRDEMQPAIGEPLDEAAAEIERLRAEIHRLRGVLEEIETPPIDVVCHGSWEAFEWAIERAADALKAPTP
jgi:hypothetical protein